MAEFLCQKEKAYILEVRNQGTRKTELFKSFSIWIFPPSLLPSFPAWVPVLPALMAMILHHTASVKPGPLEKGAEMNLPSGAGNSGAWVLSHHLGDSLSPDTMVICVGQTVLNGMFDISVDCFANCTHNVNHAKKKKKNLLLKIFR